MSYPKNFAILGNKSYNGRPFRCLTLLNKRQSAFDKVAWTFFTSSPRNERLEKVWTKASECDRLWKWDVRRHTRECCGNLLARFPCWRNINLHCKCYHNSVASNDTHNKSLTSCLFVGSKTQNGSSRFSGHLSIQKEFASALSISCLSVVSQPMQSC